MAKDYYSILGLTKSASQEDIAKAYKKLARENHPDRNPGDKAAEARFKEVQNAYDVLNDPQKKANYDQFGSEMPNMGGAGGFPFGGGGAGGGMPQVDPEMAQELFKRFFGGGGGGGAEDIFGGARTRGGRGRAKQQPAEVIDVDARVPFLTAAVGGTIGLRVGNREIDVKVPAGFEDGKKLRLANQGEYGEDIVVKVRIDPHPYFRREGKDVLLDVPLNLDEAINGGKVSVPTVEGKRVEVKIPPGTSSGSKIRLTAMGIAGGDQYLVMKIMIPKGKPSDETKQLIEQYMQANPLDARADVAWK